MRSVTYSASFAYPIGFADSFTVSALQLDLSGNCYIAGTAVGVLNAATAFQPAYSNQGLTATPTDAFIVKINPAGSDLLYGTYFGSRYSETAITSLATSSDGTSLYFSGSTNATNLQAIHAVHLPSHPPKQDGVFNTFGGHSAFALRLAA